jgi:hypothetical protein
MQKMETELRDTLSAASSRAARAATPAAIGG